MRQKTAIIKPDGQVFEIYQVVACEEFYLTYTLSYKQATEYCRQNNYTLQEELPKRCQQKEVHHA